MNPISDKIIEKRSFKAYNIFVFDDKDAVTEWMAHHLKILTSDHIGHKMSVALSGGRTPQRLYEQIVAIDPDGVGMRRINWFWGDERCVPPNDIESNYKLAADYLLNPLNISEASIFRIWGEDDPEKEAKRYHQLLDSILPVRNGYPVFDVMIQGLGEDGHTASIFPNQKELLLSQAFAEPAVNPYSGQKRVTLTGEVICNAKEIFFLATGKSKAKVFADIIHKTGNFKDYPSNFIHARHGVLTWLVDKEAAQYLSF